MTGGGGGGEWGCRTKLLFFYDKKNKIKISKYIGLGTFPSLLVSTYKILTIPHCYLP